MRGLSSSQRKLIAYTSRGKEDVGFGDPRHTEWGIWGPATAFEKPMNTHRSTSNSAASQAQRPRLRWGWILLAGMGVSICTLLLVTLVISIYAATLAALARGAPDVDRIEWLATQINWGAPVLAVLLTVGAASWVSRRAGASAVAHGTLVGVVSAISGLGIGSVLDGGPGPGEVAALALTVGAGSLGGLEARRTIAGQEVLYEVSQLIGAARSPRDILAAIGEYLSGPEVIQVSLWELVAGDEGGKPRGIELRESWAPENSRTWQTGLRLETTELPALAQIHDGTPLLQFSFDQATGSERAVMQRLGVRSAILMPRMVSEESPLVVLMIASRESRSLPRAATRTYLTACAQAGLALENLRLVEQGRELGVLAERQRLSHEIHDTLTQGFTSIIMHLAAARQADHRQAEQHLEQIGRTARDSLSEARRLVWALRPGTLEDASLPEALARTIGRFSEESGIPATSSVTGTPSPLTPEAEITLLRAAQEALANVRKHAKADRVAMTLSYMEGLVALDVRDDGVGFYPAMSPAGSGRHEGHEGHERGGLGLKGMRERVAELGGILQVESSPGEGTTLAIELPAAGERAAPSVKGAKEAW